MAKIKNIMNPGIDVSENGVPKSKIVNIQSLIKWKILLS